MQWNDGVPFTIMNLSPDRVRQAIALLDDGHSWLEVAQRLRVAEWRLRFAVEAERQKTATSLSPERPSPDYSDQNE